MPLAHSIGILDHARKAVRTRAATRGKIKVSPIQAPWFIPCRACVTIWSNLDMIHVILRLEQELARVECSKGEFQNTTRKRNKLCIQCKKSFFRFLAGLDFAQAFENFFEVTSALSFPPDAIPSASGFMYVYARIQDGSCIPGGPLKWHFAFGTCVLIMRDSVSIKMISCDASLEALCSGIGFHAPP